MELAHVAKRTSGGDPTQCPWQNTILFVLRLCHSTSLFAPHSTSAESESTYRAATVWNDAKTSAKGDPLILTR